MAEWTGDYARKWTRLTLAHYGTICHLCGQDGATTADHRIPRSQGGSDTLGNLRPAHKHCNIVRRTQPLSQWFAKHPLPTRPTAAPSREW